MARIDSCYRAKRARWADPGINELEMLEAFSHIVSSSKLVLDP